MKHPEYDTAGKSEVLQSNFPFFFVSTKIDNSVCNNVIMCCFTKHFFMTPVSVQRVKTAWVENESVLKGFSVTWKSQDPS